MKPTPPQSSLRYALLCIEADRRRYEGAALSSPGFWVTLAYRVRRARKEARWGALLLPADVALAFVSLFLPSPPIPASCRVGPGLFIAHGHGIVLNANARLGPGVSIFHQVTLGGWEGQAPRVRARAVLFPGAKVIGGVEVGVRAFVGANAVVVKDVPASHSALGQPATSAPRRDVEGAAADLPQGGVSSQ